jgi:hypothetical protein
MSDIGCLGHAKPRWTIWIQQQAARAGITQDGLDIVGNEVRGKRQRIAKIRASHNLDRCTRQDGQRESGPWKGG